MRRVLFTVDSISVATERHTEEVAAQRVQDRGGHLGLWLVLPWADVVRLNRRLRVGKELHRSHVPADFRHAQPDLIVRQQETRLRMSDDSFDFMNHFFRWLNCQEWRRTDGDFESETQQHQMQCSSHDTLLSEKRFEMTQGEY